MEIDIKVLCFGDCWLDLLSMEGFFSVFFLSLNHLTDQVHQQHDPPWNQHNINDLIKLRSSELQLRPRFFTATLSLITIHDFHEKLAVNRPVSLSNFSPSIRAHIIAT
jgi:hypothetical protein